MAGGRPQEYNEDILVKAQEYIDSCEDQEYERIKTEGDKSTSYELSVKVKIPTIEGLAVYLKVSRSTIYDWKEKFPEFSDILEQLLAIQGERLLSNGLSGTYNAKIAQLMLSKHGYVEKQEVDNNIFLPKPLDDVSEDDSIQKD